MVIRQLLASSSDIVEASDLALSSPVPEAVNGHAAPHSC